MMQVERNWLNPDGIPERPWFKHILYGARFTYAHLELPGLTEAVEKQELGDGETASGNPAKGFGKQHQPFEAAQVKGLLTSLFRYKASDTSGCAQQEKS